MRHAISLRRQPLVTVATAFAAGILVSRYVELALLVWLSLQTLSGIAWFLLWRKLWFRVATGALLLFASSVGGFAYQLDWSYFSEQSLARHLDETYRPTCLRAIAVTGPRWRPSVPKDPLSSIDPSDSSLMRVKLVSVRNDEQWQSVSGHATLFINAKLTGVSAGDKLEMFVTARRPPPPPHHGAFDFRSFLRSKRELFQLQAKSAESITKIKDGSRSPWNVFARMDDLRLEGREIMHEHIKSDRADLAAAILLGAREQLSNERTERFLTTGVIHLLAISGLHIAILTMGIYAVAHIGWLPRGFEIWLTIAFVVFYTMLTDARPPVLRAALLISAYCVGRALGRTGRGLNTLALAALLLLLFNPSGLFDTGVQLSFLAVTTLTVIASVWITDRPVDPLDALIARTRPWPVKAARRCLRYTANLFLASGTVWLISLPLVMYRFHIVSPIGLVLNPLFLPLVTVALFSGFAVLVLGYALPMLVPPVAWICEQSLDLLEAVISHALQVPGNHFWTPGPPGWAVVLFYGIFALFVVFQGHRNVARCCRILIVLWFAIFFVIQYGMDRPSNLTLNRTDRSSVRCTCISVGHGNAILLEMPNGKTMLCDVGCEGNPRSGLRSVATLLWSRGLRHIDAVILSHADLDHYNVLPALLDRFSVGRVYVSDVMFQVTDPGIQVLQSRIAETKVPFQILTAPQTISLCPDVSIDVLHPPPGTFDGSDNANSIVVQIEYAGHRILLPGDVEHAGLNRLLALPPRDVDVLVAPHHGSRNSHPAVVASWCTPDVVVISAGTKDNVEEVRAIYMASGAMVFHTAEDGTVTFDVRRTGVTRPSFPGR